MNYLSYFSKLERSPLSSSWLIALPVIIVSPLVSSSPSFSCFSVLFFRLAGSRDTDLTDEVDIRDGSRSVNSYSLYCSSSAVSAGFVAWCWGCDEAGGINDSSSTARGLEPPVSKPTFEKGIAKLAPLTRPCSQWHHQYNWRKLQPHQSPEVGKLPSTIQQTTKLIPWRVSVKSNASFDRPTTTVKAITEKIVSSSQSMTSVHPTVVSCRTGDHENTSFNEKAVFLPPCMWIKSVTVQCHSKSIAVWLFAKNVSGCQVRIWWVIIGRKRPGSSCCTWLFSTMRITFWFYHMSKTGKLA